VNRRKIGVPQRIKYKKMSSFQISLKERATSSEITQEAKLSELCSCKQKNRSEKVWKDVKCTKRFAPIVVKNVKSPSNLTAQDRYTAESALLREDPKDQIGHIEDTR